MSAAAECPREPLLLSHRSEGVATLTLNRPQARNSLSYDLICELSRALARLEEDASVRVVVLSGNGPAFCSGHDLKELRARSDVPFYEKLFSDCAQMMQAIMRLRKPVIARVHGIATAAGCQLVASCDLAIAADTARFATPGVNIGLFCSTPMVALSRNAGRKQAMEMLLTGEMLSAARAVDFGLINAAVPEAELDARVVALARQIAAKSPLTLAIGKEAFYKQLELGVSEAYAYTGAVMVKNMLAQDAREGISAFLEKRKPVWCGA